MGIIRCCVDGCKSTKKDKLLYNIPTQDELREVWLKFLIPRSPSLANMTKEQLVCRKVCELHFEEKYLAAGNRRKSRLACPTLFSVDEILSGKPATPIEISFKNFQEEHNYNLPIPENTPGPSPHQDWLRQNEDPQDANATPSTSGTTSSEVPNPVTKGPTPSLPTSDQPSSSGSTAAILSNYVETNDARFGVLQMGAHSPSSSGATRAPTSTTNTETRSGVLQMGAHSPSSSGATRAPTNTTNTETRSGVLQMGAHSPSSSGATRAPTNTTNTETRSGVLQMGAHSPSSSGATRAPTNTTNTETRSGVLQMGAHSPSSSGTTRAPTNTTNTETRSGVLQMGAHSPSSSGTTRAPTNTTNTETRSGVLQMGAHSPSSSGTTRAPTSTTNTETRSGVLQMGAHSPSSSGTTRAPTNTTNTETRSGVLQMGAHSPSSSGTTRAPTNTTNTETRSGVLQMGAHSPSSSGTTRAPTNTTNTETRSGVLQMGAHSPSSSGATDPISGNSVTQSDPTPSARASDRTGSNSDVHTLQATVGQMPSSSGNTDTHNKTTRNRIVRSINNLTPKCKSIYKKCVQIIKSKRRLIYSYSEKLDKARQLNEKESFSSMIESLTPQAKTFMHMQINLANKHVKRRRFTTEEKLLALSLAKQSPKGYKLLHKMFILPSRRTLNKFTQKIKFRPGVNKNIISQMKESVKNWDPIKKTCSVVFDEVALSPQLTYVESEDRIDGFVNFGQESEQKFCDHALVFMVRGICTSWRQPLAYYLCEGATPAIILKNILKDVVQAVVDTGLDPNAIVCDQGSTFQACINSLRADTRRHNILNNEPVLPDNQVIINGKVLNVVFDPPHLIKGIRNNFLTKDMLFCGKIAKWQDIIDAYQTDCQVGEIRMVRKLTDEHVIPAKIKKMKVKNATQTLSEQTAGLLSFCSKFSVDDQGRPVSQTMKNTSDAVLFFDRLFDSVNGSRSGAAPGKMRGPVKEVNEPAACASASSSGAAGASSSGAAGAVPTAPAPAAADAACTGSATRPQPSSSARREKINVQASAFTAGYVTRRLLRSVPCKHCNKTILTNEIGDIHDWISQRERRLLKGRNLKYPNTTFICLFRKLIKFINKYLDNSAHKGDVMKNIRTDFLMNAEVDWLGCDQHHAELLNHFMTLVCRVQIHNWCNSLNKILRGMFCEKLTTTMSKMQSLALRKYKSSRGKK